MAFTNWQAVGWFGSMADDCWDDYGYCDTSYSDRPWWNKHVWYTCECCSESVNGNKFFFIMNALFGYQVGTVLHPYKSHCHQNSLKG